MTVTCHKSIKLVISTDSQEARAEQKALSDNEKCNENMEYGR